MNPLAQASAAPAHGMADAAPDRAFAAAQAFLVSAKSFWTTEMFPALRGEYENARDPLATATPESVAATLADSTLYRYFAWAERHLQKMKYSGRYGLVAWQGAHRQSLEATLTAPVALDASLDLPRYYVSVDIHQHPGGVWRDTLAGFVYERGARSTTPLAAGRHADLHQRFAALVADTLAARSVLDLGCGFGKSTRPFCTVFPQARIEGIDLAAPCLKLAARMSADAGLGNARFRQADAARTACRPGEFDLVTSTMLLHELPPPAIRQVLEESARVLAPGGWMFHLDFLPAVQPRGDAFARFIHYGHARRNNEPFMQPLAQLDLPAQLRALGFEQIEVLPFAEADGVLAPDYPHWRFPWTVIRARKAVPSDERATP